MLTSSPKNWSWTKKLEIGVHVVASCISNTEDWSWVSAVNMLPNIYYIYHPCFDLWHLFPLLHWYAISCYLPLSRKCINACLSSARSVAWVSLSVSMENGRMKRRKIICCQYVKGEQTFNVVYIHNTRQTVKGGWTANWMDSIIIYRLALHSVFSYWVSSNLIRTNRPTLPGLKVRIINWLLLLYPMVHF